MFEDILYNRGTGDLTIAGRKCGYIQTNKDGKSYIRVGYKGKRYQAHHIAFYIHYGREHCGVIDHVNGDGTDNRIINLMEVSELDNQRNKRIPLNNSSGVVGVCMNKNTLMWHSQIGAGKAGRVKNLGTFNNLFDAVCARKSAEIKLGFHKNHGSKRKL